MLILELQTLVCFAVRICAAVSSSLQVKLSSLTQQSVRLESLTYTLVLGRILMFFRLLPWEYAIRNLFRRPLRTALTFAGLSTVILLVVIVVGFIRGLERTLAVSGDPQCAAD